MRLQSESGHIICMRLRSISYMLARDEDYMYHVPRAINKHKEYCRFITPTPGVESIYTPAEDSRDVQAGTIINTHPAYPQGYFPSSQYAHADYPPRPHPLESRRRSLIIIAPKDHNRLELSTMSQRHHLHPPDADLRGHRRRLHSLHGAADQRPGRARLRHPDRLRLVPRLEHLRGRRR